MNKRKLITAVSKAKTITGVCVLLYGNKYYGNRKTIIKYIKEYNVDISRFGYESKGVDTLGRFINKIPIEEILINGSSYDTTNLKNRLYKEGFKERKCELCGLGEVWNRKAISLVLDHINGVSNDHRIKNLRIVCPNCNATLLTHCRGKKGLKT